MIRRISAAAALVAAGAVIGWTGSAGGTQATQTQTRAHPRRCSCPKGGWWTCRIPFNEKTIYWPTADTFKLEKVAEGETEQGYFYAANNFSAAEHGGTHLDAPVHFARGGDTADEIPLRRLIGRGIVVDVTARALADRDYQVSVADLAAHEDRHGRIPRGAMVLLRTGYERYWPDRRKYLGTAQRGADAVPKLHFPGLHPDAARRLVQRRVRAVGVDTASIDYGQSKLFESHRVLGAAGVPVFENVANLRRLPSTTSS
jgi:kynurenine formamidase